MAFVLVDELAKAMTHFFQVVEFFTNNTKLTALIILETLQKNSCYKTLSSVEFELAISVLSFQTHIKYLHLIGVAYK